MPTLDPAAPNDHRGHLAGPAPVAMWLGLFLAPAAFFAHLEGAYLLVLWACGPSGGAWAVHAAGVLAVAIAAAGVWFGWVAWVQAGRAAPDDDGTPVGRTRLIALSGLGVSLVLALVLLSQTAAGFVVPTCQ